MARPQLEDGRTEIANELVEALAKLNLSAYDSRVLWCIFRKTYGWHKKMDGISYTQFEEATGLKRWHIARSLKRLTDRRIIVSCGNGYNIEYGPQKDYEAWQALPKEVTMGSVEALPIQVEALPIQVEALPKEVTEALPKEVNTKAIKHNKSINKSKAVLMPFEEYKESLKINYSDLDVESEWEACQVWWGEGKKQMNRPKSALRNWLDRARQIKRDKQEVKGNVTTNRGIPGNRPAGAFDDLK